MKIAAFPKCYLEDIANGGMTVFDWIEMARDLPAEGLEMYEGFFTSLDNSYINSVGDAIAEASFAMPMLCCSPDFTNPDESARQRAIERESEMIRITRMLGGPGAVCRVLSGQRYPEVSRQQGIEWVVECIEQVLPVAREHDVVLGLENHYKDGFWHYPEFAQKQEIFLELLAAIPEREYFGVQYDPSNAIVAGDDPLELLRAVAGRVVSMHASDRFLAPGASLESLRGSDGAIGYAPELQHGVTGRGLNDYDAIFSILRDVGYSGWVSIEDGMNGMDEMRESLLFLHEMRDKYFS
ncbi:MAG: sugar phosphate isomerase/epimerase [Chloroflexi bacterium]|nr:sugar phosphate isomerase/epimerase [Chloroflexota bacterium]MCY3582184.1 sugar phosphate isomerase/epimerase [Chloroflexota bacterium]MCY3715177.1 sugar phosphate isomerase/epimerase [Chloroflexota bacterium]MDE2649948.1 sugar phosphate isomerase/epimerase [Chloroflexota bacterium]MXX49831.1 sugar phosphate isomerase/epimerase [Chloroflexota bacterium]